MSEQIVIFGYGAIGKAATARLAAQARSVRVAQRSALAELPSGTTFRKCDALDADSVRNAAAGATQIVFAIGMPYVGNLWREAWPRAMRNVIAAAETSGARIVFVDNLYMYGPQTMPLREDMPLTGYGVKPAARAEVTRIWQAAASAGRVRFAALRAPDFYGPGVGAQSHLGDVGFRAIAQGRRATLIAPPDTPHDFAYVDDFGRAVVTLLDAPDDAFGQAWHVPCAPTRTPRDILLLGAKALGVHAKISAIPLWLLPALGLAVPMLREMSEMRFQWDRPYRVDSSRFARRFWSDVTPFEVGAPATALSFRKAG